MSQNSLVIADGTGAQVLTAINNALDTLKTLHSGPTAPGSPTAYQLWADATTGLLKIRNATNTAWLPIDRLDGLGINLAKAVTGGSYTLTEVEGLCSSFEFSGTLTSNMTIVVPNNMPVFTVENLTTGAFTLTVKTAAGTGVVIGQGGIALLYCNGTNCEEVVSRQITQQVSSANQTLASTAATKVVLGTTALNAGGNTSDTANNRITCVVPGNYIVTGQILSNTATTVHSLTLQVYKNGVAIGPRSQQSTQAAVVAGLAPVVTHSLALVAGDFVELYATSTVASTDVLQAGCSSLIMERV